MLGRLSPEKPVWNTSLSASPFRKICLVHNCGARKEINKQYGRISGLNPNSYSSIKGKTNHPLLQNLSTLLNSFHGSNTETDQSPSSPVRLKEEAPARIYFNRATWLAATPSLCHQQVRNKPPSEVVMIDVSAYLRPSARPTSHISNKRTCSFPQEEKMVISFSSSFQSSRMFRPHLMSCISGSTAS